MQKIGYWLHLRDTADYRNTSWRRKNEITSQQTNQMKNTTFSEANYHSANAIRH